MKKLTAYFSASGVTEKAAKLLAKAALTDLYEIRPEVLYTSADLNWMDKKSRSTLEMQDRSSRPAIAAKVENMEEYDTIYLCFPVWWYREPSIIDTFLESYEMKGKKIVLFATSGGSGFGDTVKGLKALVPDAEISEGRMLNGRITEADLSVWA